MDMEKDYTLNEMKKAISKAAIKYGVKAVYLFGSYAWGEATEGSDIDLLKKREDSQICWNILDSFRSWKMNFICILMW